jgi:hypothetical protein
VKIELIADGWAALAAEPPFFARTILIRTEE